MKRHFLLLAFAAVACHERSQATTATIEPAAPRPAETIADTVGQQPMVTTAGSPPPAVVTAAGNEAVTIGNGTIRIRPLMPRGATAFRLTNTTGQEHQIVVRGRSQSVAASVAANGRSVLQMRLSEAGYEIVCVTPGHDEHAAFRTYEPR